MTAPKPAAIKQACAVLAKCDPALARAYQLNGVPKWRAADASYEALARIITFQLLSTTAAGAIWGRVKSHLGEVTCEAVQAASEDDLRACGLSRPKINHLNAIAEALGSDALNLQRCSTLPLDEARKELLAVKGIGPWTADVFLINSVGAMDAFPIGDVGLMESHRMLLDAEDRLPSKAFTALAEAWRPYRGVAAHLLWGHINAVRAAAQKASPQV